MRLRGYPDNMVNKVLGEVKFADRKLALQQKPQKVQNGLTPFVTQYNQSVPKLKKILMSKWHLIENQPLRRDIYRNHFSSPTKKENLWETYRSEPNSKGQRPITSRKTAGVVFSLSTHLTSWWPGDLVNSAFKMAA